MMVGAMTDMVEGGGVGRGRRPSWGDIDLFKEKNVLNLNFKKPTVCLTGLNFP